MRRYFSRALSEQDLQETDELLCHSHSGSVLLLGFIRLVLLEAWTYYCLNVSFWHLDIGPLAAICTVATSGFFSKPRPSEL